MLKTVSLRAHPIQHLTEQLKSRRNCTIWRIDWEITFSLTWHNLASKISLEDCAGSLKTSRATVEIISNTRSNEIAKSKQVAQIFNCLDSINTRSGLDDTLWISCTMPINSENAQFNWFNSEFKNCVVACGLANNTSLTCAWYIIDGHGSETIQVLKIPNRNKV